MARRRGIRARSARRFAARLSRAAGRAAPLSCALLRVTKVARSPYDALMLQLHDSDESRRDLPGGGAADAVDFPAGSTWMAFTDQVSHAAMAGQYQLEQTFLLPVDAMLDDSRSPLRDAGAAQRPMV